MIDRPLLRITLVPYVPVVALLGILSRMLNEVSRFNALIHNKFAVASNNKQKRNFCACAVHRSVELHSKANITSASPQSSQFKNREQCHADSGSLSFYLHP